MAISERSAKRPRGPGRRFKAGESGNPKGRPVLPSDYKEAMEDLGPRGLAALANIVDDPDHPRHEQAAEYLVNRWKGAPTQRGEISGPGGGPIDLRENHMTREEMRREIERLEAGEDPPGDAE